MCPKITFFVGLIIHFLRTASSRNSGGSRKSGYLYPSFRITCGIVFLSSRSPRSPLGVHFRSGRLPNAPRRRHVPEQAGRHEPPVLHPQVRKHQRSREQRVLAWEGAREDEGRMGRGKCGYMDVVIFWNILWLFSFDISSLTNCLNDSKMVLNDLWYVIQNQKSSCNNFNTSEPLTTKFL